MAKIFLTIRIEEDTREALKRLAEADNRPLSNYVETLMKQHVAAKRRGDAGRGIPALEDD